MDPIPFGRVLVVDGDATARPRLQELLRQAGYSTVAAANAAEARHLAAREEPALAILELMFSDGNGIHLVNDLRASWPDMPALIVTSCVETRCIVQAMQAGAHDYLAKPLEPDVLLSACRSALAGRARASRRELASDVTTRLRPLREIEDAYIDRVLAATGGNRTRAARILGVARETLRTRMLARPGPS
jgi:DNA-binding NtrC family response regulator